MPLFFLEETMIKYIINTAYGSNVYKINKVVNETKNNLSIVKRICKENLFSYEGYLAAVKYKFNKYHLIPVVINKDNIFIPTKRVRDYENIWINLPQILLIEENENQTVITFRDYDKLVVSIKMEMLLKRVDLAGKILKYKLNIL